MAPDRRRLRACGSLPLSPGPRTSLVIPSDSRCLLPRSKSLFTSVCQSHVLSFGYSVPSAFGLFDTPPQHLLPGRLLPLQLCKIVCCHRPLIGPKISLPFVTLSRIPDSVHSTVSVVHLAFITLFKIPPTYKSQCRTGLVTFSWRTSSCKKYFKSTRWTD